MPSPVRFEKHSESHMLVNGWLDRYLENDTRDSDGIYRSEVFPGLWLDPAAMIRGDRARLSEVLRRGCASPEHGAFVQATPPSD